MGFIFNISQCGNFFIHSEGSSGSPLTEFNLGTHFFHVVNPFNGYFYERLKKHCFYPFQFIWKHQLENLLVMSNCRAKKQTEHTILCWPCSLNLGFLSFGTGNPATENSSSYLCLGLLQLIFYRTGDSSCL